MWRGLIGLVTVLALTGCGGNWKDFNYGPGDWLAENTGLKVDSPYSYEKLSDPVIRVHVVDDLTVVCGTRALGCAIGDAQTCDIYVGERTSPNTQAHELRHCYGWSHGERVGNQYLWYPAPGL